MADIVDKETRSRMMSGIRGKDTKPEMMLRRALHARGFRYRLHGKGLPGRPDLILAKHRAVIFVHGCFWHHHKGCRYATTPSTRVEFWQGKFKNNAKRDRAAWDALAAGGWRVATVWECALRTSVQRSATCHALDRWLTGASRTIEIGEADLADPELEQGRRHAVVRDARVGHQADARNMEQLDTRTMSKR